MKLHHPGNGMGSPRRHPLASAARRTCQLATLVLSVANAAWAQPPIPGGHALPPPPPLPASPVTTFRQLLALPTAERATALATRPPRQRESLRTRLAAYEAMPAETREERLRATDLYWHLQQLIRRAPAERATLLASASPDLQPVLHLRLAFWDQLSADDRTALLEHEGTLRYLAQTRTTVPPPLPSATHTPTALAAGPAVPLRAQAALSRLQAFTDTDRDRMQDNWRRFFEGSAPSRQRTLQELPAQERHEMELVLERFRRLSPEQRRACVGSFTRLATMSPAERAEFLRNAERWGSLTATERQAWREIVHKLPLFPPLPNAATEPPLPTARPRLRVATNGTPP